MHIMRDVKILIVLNAIASQASPIVSLQNLTATDLVITPADSAAIESSWADTALDAPSNAPVNGTSPPSWFPSPDSLDSSPITSLNTSGTVQSFSIGSSRGRVLTETKTSSADSGILVEGNYVINKCGPNSGGSHGEQLLHLIPQIQYNLQKVMDQVANQATSSPYGYAALFKTANNIAKVNDVYQKIANGTRLVFADGHAYRPQIYCVNDDDTQYPGIVEFCAGARKPLLFMTPKTNVAFICKAFWAYRPIPGKHLCPTLKFGQLVPDESWLQNTYSGMLIHELAEMYLNQHDFITIQPEPYRINAAVGLSASDSVLNPSNFAYFYSAVVAGCTTWPVNHDDDGL